MAQYQLTSNEHTILRLVDNAYIPDDPANRDYQEYLIWLDQGNVPDPLAIQPTIPQPDLPNNPNETLSPEDELKLKGQSP
jgi:hypothetical protein